MEPGLGLWSLPGGYVDRGEVVETAAEREVMEETGLDVRIRGLVGGLFRSWPSRDSGNLRCSDSRRQADTWARGARA